MGDGHQHVEHLCRKGSVWSGGVGLSNQLQLIDIGEFVHRFLERFQKCEETVLDDLLAEEERQRLRVCLSMDAQQWWW